MGVMVGQKKGKGLSFHRVAVVVAEAEKAVDARTAAWKLRQFIVSPPDPIKRCLLLGEGRTVSIAPWPASS